MSLAVPVGTIAVVVLLALLVVRRRLVAVRVTGLSMAPTLWPGDQVLVRRVTADALTVGMVAVVRTPPHHGPATVAWVIKRVAALPGDPIPASVQPAAGGLSVVPAERLVLLSDNPSGRDSRSWGLVPSGDLLGVVVMRLTSNLLTRKRTYRHSNAKAGQARMRTMDWGAPRATDNAGIDLRRPSFQVKVLGPVEVTNGDRVIQLAGRGQRALLAVLALEHGRSVTFDQLADILWNGTPPASARNKIQAHVSALRKAMAHPDGDNGLQSLVTTPSGYMLSGDTVRTDLASFGTLIANSRAYAESGDFATVSTMLGTALALWRGPVCADVTVSAIRASAAPHEERRLLAVEAKGEADLAIGRYESVVVELLQWLAVRPLRERLRALLMVALYRLGCLAEALQLYLEGRQVMIDELGLEPGPLLRELHQRILAGDTTLRLRNPILPQLAVPPGGGVA